VDWQQWSREAVAEMQELNNDWPRRLGLENASYTVDLENGHIHFFTKARTVSASICTVGSTSECEGTFLWAWANDAIPSSATVGLDAIREFGEIHDLGLLCEPEIPGGKPEALEIVAISGHILNGEGVFTHPDHDRLFFFVIKSFNA